MKERLFQFDNLVEPYYPTLNHFAAAVCGNPVIASILVPEIFPPQKVGQRSRVFGCAVSSSLSEDE